MIAPGAHGALGDRTGHGRGLGRSILLDHKKPSSMRSLGLDPCVGFWSLEVLFRRPVDVEWGRRDLNPDRRVSPTRGATHACCCEPWVSAPVCHHRNQQTRFAIKPMTGARNSTRLNYVPMGLRTRGTAAGISMFASRVGALKSSSKGVVRFGHEAAARAAVTLTGSFA